MVLDFDVNPSGQSVAADFMKGWPMAAVKGRSTFPQNGNGQVLNNQILGLRPKN